MSLRIMTVLLVLLPATWCHASSNHVFHRDGELA